MPRRPNIQRPVTVHITLPEDLWDRLAFHLISPSEGKVPYGAYTKFFSDRIREYLDKVEPTYARSTEP